MYGHLKFHCDWIVVGIEGRIKFPIPHLVFQLAGKALDVNVTLSCWRSDYTNVPYPALLINGEFNLESQSNETASDTRHGIVSGLRESGDLFHVIGWQVVPVVFGSVIRSRKGG